MSCELRLELSSSYIQERNDEASYELAYDELVESIVRGLDPDYDPDDWLTGIREYDARYDELACDSSFVTARAMELQWLGRVVQSCLETKGPACAACPLTTAQDRVEELARNAREVRGIPGSEFNDLLRMLVDAPQDNGMVNVDAQ